MTECMSNLEKYINDNGESLDVLFKAALIHYQFESIHPFLDRNSRVGRLLITLYLLQNKVITTPSLYISYSIMIQNPKVGKSRTFSYDKYIEILRMDTEYEGL